jgi:glutathione synthase/RimK-type ligase-like ATP-grasp enzyme
MMKTIIGLITYQKSPHLTESDQLIIAPLQKQGFTPIAVPWDDTTIDWSAFDVLVLRSCWNYHLKYTQFLLWLDEIEKRNIPVWNPIPILRWNSNKKYLKDLEYKGIPIVPTVLIESGERYFLSDVAHQKKWNNLVVKPAVGASSYRVTYVSKNDYERRQKAFEKLAQQSDVLVQPHIKGKEYSLVFIDKQFSHATNKISKSIIQQAKSVLKKVNSQLLYARVDGYIQNKTFLLSELELIEPRLYFDIDQTSTTRFAEILKKLMATSR